MNFMMIKCLFDPEFYQDIYYLIEGEVRLISEHKKGVGDLKILFQDTDMSALFLTCETSTDKVYHLVSQVLASNYCAAFSLTVLPTPRIENRKKLKGKSNGSL